MIFTKPLVSKNSSQACLNESTSSLIFTAHTQVKSYFPITAYGQFLKANGEQPVTWKRASSMEEVLREADVVSLISFLPS